jgi:hypothetical protein
MPLGCMETSHIDLALQIIENVVVEIKESQNA